MTGFKITLGRGFQITFENGWTASVQFGPSNYCENRNYLAYSFEVERRAGEEGCANAEIAAWPETGRWYRGPDWDDDVLGWQTPAQVLAFLNEIANLPKEG